jgi:anti-sigma factor RsiW
MNPREAEAVCAHLRDCAECRTLLEEEIRLVSRLSALPESELIPDVWPVVQSRVKPRRTFASLFGAPIGGYARRLAVTAMTFAVLVGSTLAVGNWRSANLEKERVKEAMAIMRVQPVSAVEEPSGQTTDAMMKVLEEQVPKDEM